jgi:hypothetical protein
MKSLLLIITFIFGFGCILQAQNTTLTNKNTSTVSSQKQERVNSVVSKDNTLHTVSTNKSSVNTINKRKKEKSNYNRKPELISDKKDISVK